MKYITKNKDEAEIISDFSFTEIKGMNYLGI